MVGNRALNHLNLRRLRSVLRLSLLLLVKPWQQPVRQRQVLRPVNSLLRISTCLDNKLRRSKHCPKTWVFHPRFNKPYSRNVNDVRLRSRNSSPSHRRRLLHNKHQQKPVLSALNRLSRMMHQHYQRSLRSKSCSIRRKCWHRL